ncbi:MAG: hypothetical protein LC128_12040 [Chitinophagales bacterium]|nr:hypothetical protein [Chitinophagales bacterium]
MKLLKNIGIGIAFIFLIWETSGCGPGTYVTGGVEYNNPTWAPAYYPGVRYYYLPDIETYYDLSDGDFVYLDNGQWMFSPVLPPIYANYNLYTGFVIALNTKVYRPWLHHQYYVSHYPRYYYHNVYQNNYASIRGFNENVRKPIIWKNGERDNATNHWISQKDRVNPVQLRTEQKPKAPQMTNYYGKRIGQPVKVRHQMMQGRMQRVHEERAVPRVHVPAPAMKMSRPGIKSHHT